MLRSASKEISHLLRILVCTVCLIYLTTDISDRYQIVAEDNRADTVGGHGERIVP